MRIKRNIYIMYAISLLQGMVFYTSVASLYRQARGLNLAQIAVIESISFIFSLIMELPWGILAEKIGYRKTMIVSSGFFFLSKVIFWRAEGFLMFLLERFVLSVAVAGISGVDISVLYLSCSKGDSQRVFGIYQALGTAGLLFSSFVYTVFIGKDYGLSAVCTMVSYGLAALFSIGIKEVKEVKAVEDTESAKKNTQLFEFLSLLRGTVKDSHFLLFLISMSLYCETVNIVTVWLNQNQYVRCGLAEREIGLFYMAVTVASLVSAFSKQVTDRIGHVRFSILTLLLTSASCTLLAFTHSVPLSFLCIMAIAVGNSLLSPLLNEFYNNHIVTNNRAMQLSIFAVLGDTVAAGAQLTYGNVADISLKAAFLLGAVVCGAGAIVLIKFFSMKMECNL